MRCITFPAAVAALRNCAEAPDSSPRAVLYAMISAYAELAAAGKGEMKAGDWCGFCKIKSTCRARAKANLEIAQWEFAEPVELVAGRGLRCREGVAAGEHRSGEQGESQHHPPSGGSFAPACRLG